MKHSIKLGPALLLTTLCGWLVMDRDHSELGVQAVKVTELSDMTPRAEKLTEKKITRTVRLEESTFEEDKLAPKSQLEKFKDLFSSFDTGSIEELIEKINREISDGEFISRANAEQLSKKEFLHFGELMTKREALYLVKIDRQLAEIENESM